MKNKLYLPLLILAATVLLTIYSDISTQNAVLAMKNCVKNIIPSLFPYMVMSSMIVSCGAAELIGKLLPLSRLFSLPKCASASIILGMICGFPLGAKSAVELYENGYLSKTETEVLISIANNTGPSFLIFVIGAQFWHDIYWGLFLYISQIVSAFLSAWLINKYIFPFKASSTTTPSIVSIKPFAESLSQSIVSAVISSLNICGYITFFSVISSILSEIFSFAPFNVKILLNAVLEFSKTTVITAEYDNTFSAFICGFAIGWSGLSVFCQTVSLTAPLKISLKRCVSTKLVQGILLGCLCIIYRLTVPNNRQISNYVEADYFNFVALVFIFFVMLTVYSVYKIKKRKCA